MSAPKKPAVAVPEFSSDRLALLKPFLTHEILDMALARVLTGESFFFKDALREGLDKRAVKLALIVALDINPHEHFDANEQGMLRGMTRKSYVENRASLVV